jgi:hypothetical protein
MEPLAAMAGLIVIGLTLFFLGLIRVFAGLMLINNAAQLTVPMGALLGSHHFYPFTLPHVALVVATLVSLSLITFRRFATPLEWGVAAVLLAGTLATAQYALSQWPGGDDGGGMGWLFFAGLPSMLNVCAAIVFVVAATVTFMRRRRIRISQWLAGAIGH